MSFCGQLKDTQQQQESCCKRCATNQFDLKCVLNLKNVFQVLIMHYAFELTQNSSRESSIGSYLFTSIKFDKMKTIPST